jgi:hypothetical protein
MFDILDSGYLGHIGISIFSLKDKKRSSQTYTVPFPMGSFNMPNNSETGSVRLRHKKWAIDFAAMNGGARIIKVDIPKFGHHRYLRGEVVLSALPETESLVTSMSWRRDKNSFRCARRSPCYIAEGVMQFGSSELIFTRGNAWGIFDWNRGVRPRTDVRYWASACGLSGDRQIGFSVGYDSADSEHGTENAFFLDGRLHKLEQVTFNISPANWLEPWHFTSNDKRLTMVFTPNQERIERNRMTFHSITRRQVCGSFSGAVMLDDGTELAFQDITGFAERRKTQF